MKRERLDLHTLPEPLASALAKRQGIWQTLEDSERVAVLAGGYGHLARIAAAHGVNPVALRQIRSWVRVKLEAYRAGERAALAGAGASESGGRTNG